MASPPAFFQCGSAFPVYQTPLSERRGNTNDMTTADDHWPATLERVTNALDFELTKEQVGVKTTQPSFLMRAVPPADISGLPALVATAVHAALEIDRAISLPAPSGLDPKARSVRQDLVDALNKEAPGAAQRSPFVMGYKTVYRLELARVMWKAISDAPARRLQELARARGF